jgi:hypothetical protein
VEESAASNMDGFLWRDSCILQLSGIGLFGANEAYFYLENYDLQEVFFSKATTILTGK